MNEGHMAGVGFHW